MTIISLDARRSWPGPHKVYFNGAETKDIVAVWALWNGGPGIIVYTPRNVSGHVYLNVEGDNVASAFRIGLVRAEKIGKQP